MIDEKKIEEAADKFALLERIYFNEYYPMKNGFKAGINWFKKNLWHDDSEYPKLDKAILLELASNDYVVVKLRSKYEFSEYPYTKVSRWLYIEDLMKEGK